MVVVVVVVSVIVSNRRASSGYVIVCDCGHLLSSSFFLRCVRVGIVFLFVVVVVMRIVFNLHNFGFRGTFTFRIRTIVFVSFCFSIGFITTLCQGSYKTLELFFFSIRG